MAKLTTPEVMERNCRMAIDEEYYRGIRQKIRFTLGEKLVTSSAGLSPSLSGELADDIDLLPRYYEPGQSRRILTNSVLMAGNICGFEPDPDYPDKPRYHEVVTKAFNRALWNGRPHMGPTKHEEFGEWSAETQRAFLDFDGLGTGFVQIGVKDGWTSIQHHPLGRVIWDRHRLGVGRARYIAFVHHLSEEEAVAQFGSSVKDKAVMADGANSAWRVMKAVQYFDMGLGDHEPTEIWRLNSLAGPVLAVDENEYGCLPFAHGQYLHLWGMRRPEGRISLQMADQQMRNGYERYQRLVLERGPGYDIFNTAGMDPDDQEALEQGELLTAVRMQLGPLQSVKDMAMRVGPHEPPQGLFRGLEYLDRMDPGNSGISDADRANVTSTARTLGEIQEVQEGSDVQKAWSKRQYARFLERLFYKTNYIAARLHTAPTPLSIQGRMFLANEPGQPQSNLEYWLTPQTWPVVNEDLLVKINPLRRSQIAQGKWLPLLQDPHMNPVEVRRRLLEEYGERDADRLLNAMSIQAMRGQGGGTMTESMASGGQQALPMQGQAQAA